MAKRTGSEESLNNGWRPAIQLELYATTTLLLRYLIFFVVMAIIFNLEGKGEARDGNLVNLIFEKRFKVVGRKKQR